MSSALRWIAVAALLGPAFGCSRASSTSTPPPSSWARGDVVVVEERAGEFREGVVVAIDGHVLKVQFLSPAAPAGTSLTRTLEVGEVYRTEGPGLGGGGGLGICGVAAGVWVGCRALSREGELVVAQDLDGTEHRLGSARVLTPTSLTRLNIERRFQRLEARRRFLDGARSAGRPRVRAGWRPGPRERVLAEREGVWFSATIHELEKLGAYVIWASDQRRTLVPYSSLAPEPPYFPPLEVGGYVLVRPGVTSLPWAPGKIVGTADETIGVVNEEGERRQVSPNDLVPLGSHVAAP